MTYLEHCIFLQKLYEALEIAYPGIYQAVINNGNNLVNSITREDDRGRCRISLTHKDKFDLYCSHIKDCKYTGRMKVNEKPIEYHVALVHSRTEKILENNKAYCILKSVQQQKQQTLEEKMTDLFGADQIHYTSDYGSSELFYSGEWNNNYRKHIHLENGVEIETPD